MQIRFLDPSDNEKTRRLADICFPPCEENGEYYAQDITDSRVAVVESEGGSCISMAHLRRMLLSYGDHEKSAWYICYVCTAPEYRRKGYMTALMRFVLDTLKKEGEELAFLCPVDKAVYRSLGFVHDWRFDPRDAAILYAEEDTVECSACLLNTAIFSAPDRIRNAQSFRELIFRPFTAETAAELYDLFSIRPNKSCDSVPLDTLVWAADIGTQYCLADGRCLLLRDNGKETTTAGLPLSAENELVYYFRLHARYIREILKKSVGIFLADAEGTAYLQNAGALEGFAVEEDPEIYDYIYSGDALRTLAGSSMAKKRNHVHAFEKLYAGRWEYRSLRREDAEEITRFLDQWSEKKASANRSAGESVGCVRLGDVYSGEETLSIDEAGTPFLLECPALLAKLRIGGIYIDGVLSAFSVGALNRRENMAVIEIEKADPDIPGLYQIINREFLVHEFPDAELVNREDDAGVPGLRKAKASYRPLMLERKFNITELPKE